MAAPRLPAAKAKITGAAARSPGRFKGRATPRGVRVLGRAPASLTAEQAAAWAAFADELPWLNASHRALLHLASTLRARVEGDPDTGGTVLKTYSAVLSKLAATPVDETKVAMPDADEEDPAEAYFH